MQTKMQRTKMTAGAMALAAAVLVTAAWPAGAATQNWIGNSGTWDDTTTGNWDGGAVPANTDTANLTQSGAANLSIGYTAANLTGSGLAQLTIGNSGGGTNTLNLDGTDNLPTQKMNVNPGGAINQTGGDLSHTSDDNGFNFVNTGGTLTMSGGTWSQTGGALGVRGTVNQSGGDASASGQLHLHGGTWTISDGTLGTGGGQHIYVGPRWGVGSTGPGLTAALNINGGTVTVGSVLYVGDNGSFGNTGTVTQTDGTISLGSSLVLDTDGTYNLSGGTLNSKSIQGMAAGSVFNQTGGVHYAANGCNIGGTYNLSGGSWKLDNILNVAGTVNWTGGTLDSAAPGQITKLNLNSASASWNMQGFTLTVNRWGNGGADSLTMVAGASLHGYGTVQDARFGLSSPGTFKASGRVIADGYGVERTLDASRWNSGYLTNPTDNTTNYGWFATNYGKLALPAVSVGAGDSSANLGEAAADTDIDLVNSARLAFTGASAGTLSGSLLATGRTDVAYAEPANNTFISVHDLAYSASPGSVVVTIRYDDAAVQALDLEESDLKLWHDSGAAWVEITGSVDTVNKRITGSAVSTLGQFAVAAYTPPPAGTVVSIK